MVKLLLIFSLIFVTINCQSSDKEWWRTATFYQIYPRSFMDSNHDGIGDIKGIIQRLDHLKDAGFDTYWLSPVFKSPQVDTGYDISDFYQIEPDYGNMADFDALIAKSKELGIRVMLDFIPNHSSDLHDWFIRSCNNETKYRDFYVWHDGRPNPAGGINLPPNNWKSVFGGSSWTYVETRKQYYYHQFYPQQPDLNYRNEALVKEMSEMLKFYVRKGVSGFRLDAFNHLFEDEKFEDEPRVWWLPEDRQPEGHGDLDHIYTKDLNETFEFVYNWRKMLDDYGKELNIDSDLVIMTEAYASTYDTMRYYRDPNDATKRGAHMPFNFQIIFNFDTNAKAERVKNGIFEWLNNMPSNETANWVVGSHDHSRVASRVQAEKIHLLNTLVTTLPGASITYYGEEIGMFDNINVNNSDGRNKNRTPMQWNAGVGAGFTTLQANETWLPIHPNYEVINVQAQREQPRSTYKYFQSLTKLRRTKALREGSFEFKIVNDDVFAYTREIEDEGYLIIINTSGMEQHVNLTEFKTLNVTEMHVATAPPNSLFDVGHKVNKTDIHLGLYDALVLHYTSTASGIASLSIMLLLSTALAYLLK